jgi:hypothetical protein
MLWREVPLVWMDAVAIIDAIPCGKEHAGKRLERYV